MPYLEIAIGLVLLLAGGEFLVRGAVGVARRMGVSTLMIGLTLVGFGTSTPELVTSLQGALAGSPGIAVGNVVGSNIANILLILGLSAALLPILVDPKSFRRDGSMLVLISVAATGIALIGHMGVVAGLAFVAALIGYIYYTYLTERTVQPDKGRAEDAVAVDGGKQMPLLLGIAFSVGGLAAVVYGAGLLVDGAIVLAKAVGISDTVIGLTLVAIGTSLPEMVTSVMAAIRKQADVAFGNIVGSNIYNILGILGVTAIVNPLDVPPEIIRFDIWVMLGTALLMTAFVAMAGKVLRWHGLTFLALYAGYIAVQVSPGLRAGLGIA